MTAKTAPSTSDLQTKSMQQMETFPAADCLGAEPLAITLRGIVDGSVSGSTNVSVLRYDSANDVLTGRASSSSTMADGSTPEMQVTHSATLGDSITIRRRGRYKISMVFSQAASNEARLGLSADVAAAALLAVAPAMSSAGMLRVGGALLPAATAKYHSLEAEIRVTEAEALAGKVVRSHGTVAAGTVILDASIAQNTDCLFSVERVDDLPA